MNGTQERHLTDAELQQAVDIATSPHAAAIRQAKEYRQIQDHVMACDKCAERYLEILRRHSS